MTDKGSVGSLLEGSTKAMEKAPEDREDCKEGEVGAGTSYGEEHHSEANDHGPDLTSNETTEARKEAFGCELRHANPSDTI